LLIQKYTNVHLNKKHIWI